MALKLAEPLPSPFERRTRSADSLAFQDFWFGLRGGKLIPRRDDFAPGKAVRFLRDLILVEVPQPDSSVMRVRLVGSGIDAQAGKSIVGHNYLDFVPPNLHEGVLQSARAMLDCPCGLWQVMPIHYELGIAQHAEITAFPLAPTEKAVAQIVCLAKFAGMPILPKDVSGKVMIVETAVQYEFIDVGNGVPQ